MSPGKRKTFPCHGPKCNKSQWSSSVASVRFLGTIALGSTEVQQKGKKKYKIAEGIKWKYPVPISIAMSNPLFSIQRQLSDCRVGFRVSIPVFSSANVFSKILLPLYGAGF